MPPTLTRMANKLLSVHKGISFHVTYTLDPKNVDKFIDILRPAWEHTCRTPECVYFDVFKIRAHVDTIRITEVWNRDMEWLEKNHISTPHMQEYMKASEALVLKRELDILDRLENWSVVKDGYLDGSVKSL